MKALRKNSSSRVSFMFGAEVRDGAPFFRAVFRQSPPWPGHRQGNGKAGAAASTEMRNRQRLRRPDKFRAALMGVSYSDHFSAPVGQRQCAIAEPAHEKITARLFSNCT